MAFSMGAAMFSQRSREEGADVVFEVGEEALKEEIWAHKNVLTAVSSMMKAQLTGAFREAREQRVRVPDIQARPFKGFLELIYTGSATVPHRTPLIMEEAEDIVHITNVKLPLAEWKSIVRQKGLLAHLSPGRDVMYTRATKTSGKVDEVWLSCATPADATAALDKLGSEVGHGEIVNAQNPENPEFIMDVVMLLDRYGITGCSQWAESQVKPYIGFKPYMKIVMCRGWSLTPGSVYRNAILRSCKEALRDQYREQDHVPPMREQASEENEGDVRMKWQEIGTALETFIFPLPPAKDYTGLQVRLQFLQWSRDIFQFEDFHPKDFYELQWRGVVKREISEYNQAVIDRWSGNDQHHDEPAVSERDRHDGEDAKRRRLEQA